MPTGDIPAELVVTATKVLHERVPGTDHPVASAVVSDRASAVAGPSDAHDRRIAVGAFLRPPPPQSEVGRRRGARNTGPFRRSLPEPAERVSP
jgi:hypothetical protein